MAGHGARVVEGMHEGAAGAGHHFASQHFAIGGEAIVGDDFGAAVASGDHFGLRRIVGHDDGGVDAERLGGDGDGLAVVAGGDGNDALGAIADGDLAGEVGGAADLEGAGGLEVLALQKAGGSGAGVEAARRHDGRAFDGVGDADGGIANVLGGEAHGRPSSINSRPACRRYCAAAVRRNRAGSSPRKCASSLQARCAYCRRCGER